MRASEIYSISIGMKTKKIVFAAACVLAACLFAAHEFLLNFHPETLAARNVIKFFISAIPLCLAAAAWKSKKSAFALFMALGFLACWLGDIVINISLYVSIALYLVGHSLFIRGFFCCKRPRAFQFALWGVLLLAIWGGIIFVSQVSLPLKIAGCVYAAFMSAMVAFSFCGPLVFCAGGIIFGISDILLMLNMVLQTERGWPHILSLGTYYIGVMLMSGNLFLSEQQSA